MRTRFVGILVSVMLAGIVVPMTVDASQREPGYLARSASIPAFDAAPPQTDRSSGSGLVMLVGFLGLIAALLTHWSRDSSCRDERSVYRRTDEAA